MGAGRGEKQRAEMRQMGESEGSEEGRKRWQRG